MAQVHQGGSRLMGQHIERSPLHHKSLSNNGLRALFFSAHLFAHPLIRWMSVAAGLLTLVGCANQSPDELAYIAAQDHAACSRGYKHDTAEYRGCRQLIERKRDQLHREKVGLAISRGLQAYSEAQARAAAFQPRQTTCAATGAVINCTTY